MMGYTKPVFYFCLQTPRVLRLPTLPLLESLLENLISDVSTFFTTPLYRQPFCNVSFLSLGQLSFSVPLYPLCANLYMRPVNVEAQSSFRVVILSEDVPTEAPKLPIMTERLCLIPLQSISKLTHGFKQTAASHF